MKRILLFVFIFCHSFDSFSCINEFVFNSEGQPTMEERAVLGRFKVAFDVLEIQNWLKEYDLNNIEQYDIEIQSDIAVQYLKLGDFEQAVAIFERLVKEQPNQYEFNSNLGTTYELLGKNKLALKYIKKGLELNPDSHDGSEWIHIKILEAKIAISKNPNWLKNNKIVNLTAELPALINQYKTEEDNHYSDDDIIHNAAHKLSYNLSYQLETRVPFAPAPDLFMALLFEELANFTGKYTSTSWAYSYAMIGQYYATTEEMRASFHPSIEHFKKLTDKNYGSSDEAFDLPDLNHHIDTSKFYDGKNGVNWFKESVLEEERLKNIAEKKAMIEALAEDQKTRRLHVALFVGVLIILIMGSIAIFRRRVKESEK